MFDFFEKKLQALWTGGNICLDMLAAGDFKFKFLNDEHRIWIYFHLTFSRRLRESIVGGRGV